MKQKNLLCKTIACLVCMFLIPTIVSGVTLNVPTEGTLEQVIDDWTEGQVVINIEKPGQLGITVVELDDEEIFRLKIVGCLNSDDLKYLFESKSQGKLANLESIDLSDVTFEYGGDAYASKTIVYDDEWPIWTDKTLYYLSESENYIPGSHMPGLSDYTTTTRCYSPNLAGLFMGGHYKHIIMPKSVTKAARSSFEGCKELQYVEFTGNIKGVDARAFWGCINLREVDLTDVDSIDDAAFYNCETLEKIGNLKKVKYIGKEAFYDCKTIKSVSLPDKLTCLSAKAFSGCSSLREVTCTESLMLVHYSAFDGTPWLNNTPSENGIKYMGHIALCYDNGSGIAENSSATLIFKEGTTYISEFFSNSMTGTNRGNITGLGFPASLIKIGESAFENSSISSIIFPNNLEFIGNRAFYSSKQLTKVTYNIINSVGTYLFGDCTTLEEVNIGEKVRILPEGIFAGCNALKVIKSEERIDGTPLNIGNSAFKDCYSLMELQLPEGVTGIGDYAFYNCSWLPSVTIPNSVTSIGVYAFFNCFCLTSMTIPNSVISIGSSAFYKCSNLRSVTIPNSVTEIGQQVFMECTSLRSVIIPNSVTTLGAAAFMGCYNLNSIIVGNSVTSIDDRTFEGCELLTSIIIPNSVTSIGQYAFNRCYDLTSVTIPSSVTSIGWYAFNSCSSLSEVYCYAEKIPRTYSYISDDSSISSATLYVPAGSVDTYKATSPWRAFGTIKALTGDFFELSVINGLCYNLYDSSKQATIISDNTIISGNIKYTGNITVPETVTYKGETYRVTAIGDYAFSNCSDLTSLTICSGIQSIGQEAFYNCTGELTVNFNIPSASSWDKRPFMGSKFSSLTIGNGVESIGDDAFYGCTSLTSLTLGNSVTSIGNNAFSCCNGLTSITIPNSVKSIGEGTFSACDSLTEVIIGNSVTSIGKNAFSNCDGLAKVTIGKSVTSIGQSAFYNCTGELIVNCNIPSASSSIEGAFHSSKFSSVIIGDSIESIGDYAFSGCSDLTSATIGNNVRIIGNDVFYSCSGLKNVTIGNRVTTIGDYAFSSCSGLTSLKIPSNVTTIGNGAFRLCSGLIELDIPNSVTSIGDNAFYSCNSLTSLTIGCGIQSIGRDAFLKCTGELTVNCNIPAVTNGAFHDSKFSSVVIGDSVETIGDYAFMFCDSLKKVIIGNRLTSIGKESFYGCNELSDVYCYAEQVPNTGSSVFPNVPISSATLHVPDVSIKIYKSTMPWSGFGSIQKLSGETPDIPEINGIYYEFDTNSKHATVISGDTYYMGSVTIPETVTYNDVTYNVISIGNGAFKGCSNLTAVTIPNSVANIGDDAFSGCSNLTDVYCYAEQVPNTGDGIFSNVPISSATLYIPATLLNLYLAYEPWSGFGTIMELQGEIPDMVELNAIYYNLDASLKQATVIAGNNKYSSSVTIPEIVTYNGLLFTVTEIGNYAFDSCYDLEEITIGNSVTSIGESAFSGCSGLTEVTIPNSVTEIGKYAFESCYGLKEITIGNSVTSIGYNAFRGCSRLTSISVESGNTVYDSRNNCNAIIETSSNALILGCNNSVIPDGVTAIGDYAFRDCSRLTSVTIPNSVTEIGNYAFAGCSNMTSVIIPNSVTTIGDSAFESCYGLSSVTIPNSVICIGEEAFRGCSSLTSISVESGNTKYDSRDNCNAIIETTTNTLISGCKNSVIPDGVTAIGNYAFCSCDSLTSVTIPNSVKTIGKMALALCYDMTSLTIGNSVTEIGSYAFYASNGLTSLTIPNSVTTIGSGAFSYSDNLISVYIGRSVTSIGNGAFEDCSSLTDVYCYAKEVPSTESDVFGWVDLSTTTLHVPATSFVTYNVTEPWSEFGTIVALSDTLRGDVNGDGEVNVGDLVSVSNFMAGDESVSKDAADVNQDGEVNVGDMVVISNIMSGNE